jgi:hypothetical protein
MKSKWTRGRIEKLRGEIQYRGIEIGTGQDDGIPQSAIRNRKAPSEKPFPWPAPEGRGRLFRWKSFKVRDSWNANGKILSCQDKI